MSIKLRPKLRAVGSLSLKSCFFFITGRITTSLIIENKVYLEISSYFTIWPIVKNYY